jgi:hypothetical protein
LFPLVLFSPWFFLLSRGKGRRDWSTSPTVLLVGCRIARGLRDGSPDEQALKGQMRLPIEKQIALETEADDDTFVSALLEQG